MADASASDGSASRPGPDWAERFNEAHERAPDARHREMRRVADAARQVIERLVATRAPEETLARAADLLEEAVAALAGHPQGRVYEGFAESANAGDPHAFFDHSPMIGHANPLAPPLRLSVVDGRIHGEARFGSAYEGPPGAVHGGYVAAAFDEVLGMAQSLGGTPGMTGTLTIRYRSPTPLHTDLRFEASLDRKEGRKLFTTGRLVAGDRLCAEAEGLFIAVDFSKIAELMGGRTGDR
jgi:acyl-coenzyme A thioesterase PaaI-like protein